MNIRGLRVQNLRSHSDSQTIDFSARVTIISGLNGSGKTTLFEAIYIALRGKSFRGSDKELLQKDKDWWRIDLRYDDDLTRIIKFDPARVSGKKKFEIQNRSYYRLPASLKVPVVLFEPDDLRLLHGSPSRRRSFIDDFIEQVDPSYHGVVLKYERALKQRNMLLKQATIDSDDLFIWDVALSEYGAQIVDKRIQIIERINQRIGEVYSSIAGVKDSVELHYSHTYISNIQQKIANDLVANLERDKLLGYTTTGPHRHDVIFNFNGSPAIAVASRGEVRSIVLALKFIEVDIAREVTGAEPIVLLDDVFAELDETRQKALAKKCDANQLFITTASLPDIFESAEIIQLG